MIWLRIAAAALVAVFVIGGYAIFDVAGAQGDEGHGAAHRWRELFWMMIFVVVMATSVLAALRRWSEHARHAIVAARRR